MKPKAQDRVADYAWLCKGRKYWNVWFGNPFMIRHCQVLISPHVTREMIIDDIRKAQSEEKKRFTKQFPNQDWSVMP